MFPLPGITLAETFQLLEVRPAPDTSVVWKVTTVWSKVKSPWNPTRLSAGLIVVIVTGCVKFVTAVVTVATGRLRVPVKQVVAVGVGVNVGVTVGVKVAVAVAVAVAVGVGVGDGVPATQLGNLKLPIRVLQLKVLVVE